MSPARPKFRPEGAAALVLLLAACAPGERGSSGPAPWFRESAADRGLVFEHSSGHTGRHLFPEIIGGGGALFDMDGDGDLDAYLVQSGTLDPAQTSAPNQLFENDGRG